MKKLTLFKNLAIISLLIILLFIGFYLLFNIEIRQYKNFYTNNIEDKILIMKDKEISINKQYSSIIEINKKHFECEIIFKSFDENTYEVFFNNPINNSISFDSNILIKIHIKSIKLYQWITKF
ncbi:hypothetical protein MADP15_00132 [Mycoplasma anatis]|nr:hypothetical protein [Mycoplasmopsis anatis]MBW0600141.1 hypothetical protein [Mycoplasmopsis anatis]